MPLFGAHFSVAGGLTNAVDTAVRFGCPALQLFTKNASQWAAKPLEEENCAAFRKAVKTAKIKRTIAHDSYLINLAAPADDLFEKSIAAFAHEIERADLLGLDYLVMHPGAHVGSGEEAGLNRVVAGIDESLRRTPDAKTVVLVEATAGQGSTLGWKFEHLGFILKESKFPKRLGVCIDTCHIFAAGYGLGTEAEYEAVFEHFDDVVGLKKIKAFHLNDSVKRQGSRVDRHAGIGEGHIGEAAFRRLVRDPRFDKLPMILETPKDKDGVEMDPVNLAKLRGYLEA